MRRAANALVLLWLGAAILFTVIVAPAAFAVLPTRALAGALVGRVIPVLFWSGALIGSIVLASMRRPAEASRWRGMLAAALILASLGAQLGVAPRIERARQSLGPSVEAVDPSDPRRLAFGRLHALSVLLLGAGMIAAAGIALGGLASEWRGIESIGRRRAVGRNEATPVSRPPSPVTDA